MRPLNYQPYTRGFEQQALSDLFSFIQEHGTTYTVLFTSPHIPEFNQALLSFFQQKLTQHTDELSRFDFPGVGVNRLVVAWYGVSALLGTIIMWVQSNHLNNRKTSIATMITHTYPLSEIQAAFDTAIAAKDSIKVIVDLEGDVS